MTRLRLLLACLVMLAIPLQGFAAAAMLFCAPGAAHHAVAERGAAPERQAGHDHAAHSHAHTAGPSVQDAGQGDPVAAPDAGHTCSVCASCCHSAVISEAAVLRPPEPLPQAHRTDAPVPVVSRPSVVPDKPPRA